MSIRTLTAADVKSSVSRHDSAEIETAALIDEYKKGDRVAINYDGKKTDPLIFIGTITKRSMADKTVFVRFDDGETAEYSATRKWIIGRCTSNKVRKTALEAKDLPKWVSAEDVDTFLGRARPKTKLKPKVTETTTKVQAPVQSTKDKKNTNIPSAKQVETKTTVKTEKIDKIAKKGITLKPAEALKEYEKTYRNLYNKQVRKAYITKYLKGENTNKLSAEIRELEDYARELEKVTDNLAECSKIRRQIIAYEGPERQKRMEEEFRVAIEQYKPEYF